MKLISFLKGSAFQSIFALFVKVGSAAVGFLLFTLLARLLGAEEFGNFTALFSFAMVFSLIGAFGQQDFLVRYFPFYYAENNNKKINGLFLYSISIPILLLVSLYLPFVYFSPLLGLEYLKPELSTVYLFASLFSLTHVSIGMLRVLNKTIYSIFTRDLLWRAVCMVLVYFWIEHNSSIFDVFDIMLLLLIPIFVHHLYQVMMCMKQYSKYGLEFVTKEWSGVSLSLCFISLISGADLYLYTLVVNYKLSPVETGAFFSSVKIAELLNMVFLSVALIFATKISFSIGKGDLEQTKRYCRIALILFGLPTLILSIVILIFSDVLLGFFSPEYSEYSNVLYLVVLALVTNIFSGMTGSVMQFYGKHWQLLFFQSFFLIFAMILSPFFIDYFGVVGAAVSYLISKGLWNVVVVYYLKNKFSLDVSVFSLFTYLGSYNSNSFCDDLKFALKE